MDETTCIFCNKIFTRKQNLTRHLNNNKCKVFPYMTIFDLNRYNNDNECNFCSITLGLKNNLTIHLKDNCKVFKNMTTLNIYNKIKEIQRANLEYENIIQECLLQEHIEYLEQII